jgi:DNA (cytosine-5)-methyltransferase 1
MRADSPIPVIDLFAGPGGLGEGFASLTRDLEPVFKIKLSIEKDLHAYQTLQLRAFFRSFRCGEVPDDYYDYLTGRIDRDELFRRRPEAATEAKKEAWHAELGAKNLGSDEIDRRISAAISRRKNWVLLGGPPCQAYSIVGRSRLTGTGEDWRLIQNPMKARQAKRARMAKRRKYEADPRHKLYRHYLRILAKYRPPVFVMENVKGLLSAKIKDRSLFSQILADLRRPGIATGTRSSRQLEYRLVPLSARTANLLGEFEPEDFVVRSEKYGIPQTRHRIIILGIRADIAVQSRFLTPAPVRATADDVIADLPRIRSGLSQELDSSEAWREAVRAIRYPSFNGTLSRHFVNALLRSSRRLGANLNRGARFLPGRVRPRRYASWFCDPKLQGVCNHESRSHIRSDLHRYFFAAVFAKEFGRSPLLEDFPTRLLPNHENVTDALNENKFNDRFRVQMKSKPATTVVSHISKDGHYYIHYDASQCRSLTVREAARLQTFPDNYFFEGPRTEQYKQVGNAVPPLLARQIAEIVATLLA